MTISARTKSALAAAKARGVVLGGDRGGLNNDARVKDHQRSLEVRKEKAAKRKADLLPIVEAIRASGAMTLQQIADRLNARGIPTARGGAWQPPHRGLGGCFNPAISAKLTLVKTTSLTFVLVLTLPSCRQAGNAPAPAAESSVRSSQPSEADYWWQRTLDCAARVDGMMQGEKTYSTPVGVVAHYSPKYGRCFARVSQSLTVQAPSGNRQTSVTLMDTSEGSVGAMLPFTGPCYLAGKKEDCAKVEAFIDDVMSN